MSLRHIKLTLRLIELVLQTFIFLHAQLKIASVARLQVLLDLHAKNVSINRQLHLLRELLELALLHFKLSSLVRNSAFKTQLTFFVRLNLLAEALLVSGYLVLNLFVVGAEVVVEHA